jgi:hypothetical protein
MEANSMRYGTVLLESLTGSPVNLEWTAIPKLNLNAEHLTILAQGRASNQEANPPKADRRQRRGLACGGPNNGRTHCPGVFWQVLPRFPQPGAPTLSA